MHRRRTFRSERLGSFMLGPVEDRSPDPLAKLPVVQVQGSDGERQCSVMVKSLKISVG